MIKFSGYKEQLSDVQEENEMLNLVAFLEESLQLYREFQFNADSTLRDNLDELYAKVLADLESAIGETNTKVEQEVNKLKETFPTKKFTNYRFAYWRIDRVGLTGKSLMIKLNLNRANWQMFYNENPTRYLWSESDKDDARIFIDLTVSILHSLTKAWGLGDIVREMIDLVKALAKKWVSVKDE